ncbi:MAG: hypothetical protein ACKOWF_10535 [Chloroflexota bacterium]
MNDDLPPLPSPSPPFMVRDRFAISADLYSLGADYNGVAGAAPRRGAARRRGRTRPPAGSRPPRLSGPRQGGMIGEDEDGFLDCRRE